MSRANRIWLTLVIVLLGFFLSVSFHYLLGVRLGFGYPLNTFLWDPQHQFSDFLDNYRYALSPNPYVHPINYPPFAWWLVRPMTWIPVRASLLLSLASFAVFHLVFVARRMPLRGAPAWVAAIVLTFFAYPTLFVLDRANLEAQIFILIALFLLSLERGRNRLAAVLLALAAAAKGTPAIFGALFLWKRRYRVALGSAALAAALTLASFLLIPESASTLFAQFAERKEHYLEWFVLHPKNASMRNTSLWGLFHYLIRHAFPSLYPSSPDVLRGLASAYSWLAAFLLASTVWLAGTRPLPDWKRLLLLVSGLLLAPHSSFDYRLLYLAFPMLEFFREKERAKSDWAYCLLFGLLLVPKHYSFIEMDTTFGSPINALLLLGAYAACAREALSPAQKSGP